MRSTVIALVRVEANRSDVWFLNPINCVVCVGGAGGGAEAAFGQTNT